MWLEAFGPELARKHATKLPPKCLAGRWDSTYQSEAFLVEALAYGQLVGSTRQTRQLPHIMKRALTTKSNKETKALTNTGIEDPLNESTKEYTKRLGKWRKDTVETLDDASYPFILSVVTDSHTPLQHHMAFISKTMSDADLCTKGGHLSQLASGRGQKIFAECHSCFDNVDWARNITMDAPLMAISPLLELGVLMNAHHAAAYQRRVIDFLARLLAEQGLHLHRQTVRRTSDISEVESRARLALNF